MDKIDNIIQGLSPIEKVAMFHTLQKELKRVPEYIISHDENGYYVKCESPQLNAFRFEEKKYAELAYHIYNNVRGTGTSLSDIIKYTFRLLNLNSKWIE